MDKLENIKERINGKKYIQVAHNAFTFNHHLEILESLEHFRKENIKIIVPLSYGNDWTNVEDGYVDKVIEKAEDIFDSKAECLVRMMPSDKYTNLLCNIDIGIYGATRQNGTRKYFTIIVYGK